MWNKQYSLTGKVYPHFSQLTNEKRAFIRNAKTSSIKHGRTWNFEQKRFSVCQNTKTMKIYSKNLLHNLWPTVNLLPKITFGLQIMHANRKVNHKNEQKVRHFTPTTSCAKLKQSLNKFCRVTFSSGRYTAIELLGQLCEWKLMTPPKYGKLDFYRPLPQSEFTYDAHDVYNP